MAQAKRNMNEPARYSNYFEIGQNAYEFLLEFGQCCVEGPEPVIHTRIVISPFYTKSLLELLEESVRGHEEAHGRIAVERE